MNGNKQRPAFRQAEKFRLQVRVALAKRDMTVNALVKEVGKPRTSVSKAINQGIFPKIQQKIAEVLAL